MRDRQTDKRTDTRPLLYMHLYGPRTYFSIFNNRDNAKKGKLFGGTKGSQPVKQIMLYEHTEYNELKKIAIGTAAISTKAFSA